MFPYTLRISRKSRHVGLKVTPRHGLEIIIPAGFDESKIPEVIARKKEWIARALERMNQRLVAPVLPAEIPQVVTFHSIGVTFTVVVEHHSNRDNYLFEENGILKLHINPQFKKVAFILLNKWLQEKARKILLPWLDRVSTAHGFTYAKAGVRYQRTKWGSCSSKNSININRTLVFLPMEVVEYLFIHELCHTVQRNHSAKFWALVEQHCPNYKLLDKELKTPDKYLGGWVN